MSLEKSGWQDSTVVLPIRDLQAQESRAWDYGTLLGKSLLDAPGIARFLTYAQGRNPERVFLRLEIEPSAAQADALVWERIVGRYVGTHDVFATSPCISLVRGVPKDIDEPPPPRKGPLGLMLVIASPRELSDSDGGGQLSPIDSAAEIGSLDAAWRSSIDSGLLKGVILARVDDKLRQQLEDKGYTVLDRPATLEAIADAVSTLDGVHIICHGKFRIAKAPGETDEAFLLFEELGRVRGAQIGAGDPVPTRTSIRYSEDSPMVCHQVDDAL